MRLFCFPSLPWANVMINIGFCSICVWAKMCKIPLNQSQGLLVQLRGNWARTAQRLTCGATSTSATAWRRRGRRWGAVWPTWRRRRGRAKRSSAPAKVRLSHLLRHWFHADLSDWQPSAIPRSQAAGLTRSPSEAEGGGVSGGGAPQGGGGATIGRGEGESEEGGVGAFHTGNHTGQQPPGHTHG